MSREWGVGRVGGAGEGLRKVEEGEAGRTGREVEGEMEGEGEGCGRVWGLGMGMGMANMGTL